VARIDDELYNQSCEANWSLSKQGRRFSRRPPLRVAFAQIFFSFSTTSLLFSSLLLHASIPFFSFCVSLLFALLAPIPIQFVCHVMLFSHPSSSTSCFYKNNKNDLDTMMSARLGLIDSASINYLFSGCWINWFLLRYVYPRTRTRTLSFFSYVYMCMYVCIYVYIHIYLSLSYNEFRTGCFKSYT